MIIGKWWGQSLQTCREADEKGQLVLKEECRGKVRIEFEGGFPRPDE